MSTKTIAVETSVYDRLAEQKRDSESFTKVIARLLSLSAESHTGGDIASSLRRLRPLESGEAEQILKVVQENRTAEEWTGHDLR